MKKTVLLSAVVLLASNSTFAAYNTQMMEEHSSMMNHQNEALEHTQMSMTPTRTIKVTASDNMSFTPNDWFIKQGEVVRFVVTNQGNLNHEFAIGDHVEMLEHAEMMKTMPNMQHEQGNALSLKPGETKELTWSFSNTGILEAACNVPGHYDSGMKSRIIVTKG